MLSREIFTLEYIRGLQKKYKKDPGLLERVMYAFGLLEALAQVGMDFVFKGGTSLLLLTEHPLRLSTDIDIIVEPGTDVEKFVMEAAKIFPFKHHEKQSRKVRKTEKAYCGTRFVQRPTLSEGAVQTRRNTRCM